MIKFPATLLLLLASGFLAISRSSTPKQPNIVFIVADDMGYQDVGFRGSNIRTPNIDRLAREGVILENHYVMAVCAPARATLMTGRYPIRTGFWQGNLHPTQEFGLGLDETLLPEMLKRNGYATHGVGKWHCGTYTWDHTPAKRGFDTYFGLFLGIQDYYTHHRGSWLDFREDYHDADSEFVDDIRDDLDGHYNTYLFTDRSLELISNHDKSQPLFLYLAYTAPHTPYQAPLEDIEKYYNSDSIQDSRKIYATMISIMDDGIGKIADALKDRDMMDNTIIVFTSDNGARRMSQGSNFPLRGDKGTFLEGGVRSLAFVNSPLIQKTGYINTNLHHFSDWYATFQNLAGDNPKKHVKTQLPIDGVDIWSSIDNDLPCREEVLLEFRDSSKYLNAVSDVPKTDLCDNENCFDLSGVLKFKDGELTFNAQDFLALRWKNWKILAGSTFELRGWTTKNNGDGYIGISDGSGDKIDRSHVSGTLLFDLSSDVSEERNVAGQYPDIVLKLLAKRQGYLAKVVPLQRRQLRDDIVMDDGVWRPWAKDEHELQRPPTCAPLTGNVSSMVPDLVSYATEDRVTLTCVNNYIISWAASESDNSATIKCGGTGWVSEPLLENFSGAVGCVECNIEVECTEGTCSGGECVCIDGHEKSTDYPSLCTLIKCPILALTNTAADVTGPYSPDTIVTVTCNEGYHVAGTDSETEQTLNCNLGGAYDVNLKPCVEKDEIERRDNHNYSRGVAHECSSIVAIALSLASWLI
ncbi:arylsulfatase B-like [Bolinopsis microptera]|uniref:arylsulfatase B-like n=1 Tax=Bolinopsis microptera TaxID=2820187 RepID=UPI003079257C